MIKGEVLRGRSKPTGTPGAMSLENGFASDTQELSWHDNERGRSCTAAGVDHGRVWWSPTLKRFVVRFEPRNGRKDCLIHNGNWAADEEDLDGDGVPEVTQVHGCTEVGRGFGEIQRPDGHKQWGIMHSGPTLDKLIDSLRCDPADADTILDVNGERHGFHDVQITFRWAPGCAPKGDIA